jgi:LysR family hydrogen peroxide-inducible transcriptional activator
MVQINFRDLRYLVAVADHEHFGRAAAACYVSQPTLSTQLKKLEQYLGVQLVERTNKQVMLTPTGRTIAARSRRILNDVTDIVETARAAGDPMSGELRIGLIPTVGPYLLPPMMPALTASYPGLRPLLYEEQTRHLLDRLHRGELDAAIMATPVEDDGLHHASLFNEPFYLAMPANHPLAERDTIEMSDLEAEAILLLEEGHCLRDQALDVCNMVGAREEAAFRATSMETLKQMVAADLGMTLIPGLAAHTEAADETNKHLALRPFRSRAPHRTLALYWRKGAAREPAITAVANVIRSLGAVERLTEPVTEG